MLHRSLLLALVLTAGLSLAACTGKQPTPTPVEELEVMEQQMPSDAMMEDEAMMESETMMKDDTMMEDEAMESDAMMKDDVMMEK